MTPNVEKHRIALSRIAALIVLFFLVTTQSAWEERNRVVECVLFLIGVLLVAVASLGRMWCSLYIAGYKGEELITQGPYSICRNPLYLFSLIGVAGVGFASETLTFPIVLIGLFAIYYRFVIKSEEERLKIRFGSSYEEYTKKVPAFFPRRAAFVEPENYNVKPAVYRRHMFSALWFIWVVGMIEILEGMKDIGVLKPLWWIY